jgi:hypothetical protein
VITPVFEAPRCTVIGSTDGRGGGPTGRTPRRCLAWPGGIGLGRVRSSSGLKVEEHQRGTFDADADPAAGEDLRGEDDPSGQRDGAGPGDRPHRPRSPRPARP